MDEKEVAHKVLRSMLGTVEPLGTHRVRIVNLSVYDQHFDPDAFTTSFETLAHGTIAQDARVNLRFPAGEALGNLPAVISAKLISDRVCLDSVEVD